MEDLVTGLRNPSGLALDASAGKLYWSDSGTDKIQRSNLDGSEVEDLVTSGLRHPSGLALDAVAGKLYWTDYGTDRIQRANLDGSEVEDVVTDLRSPLGLALDAAAGKLYWADYGTDKIQRSNLDGTEVEDLVTTGLRVPRGLALDASAGKLYWSDSGTDKIQRANLDGTEVEDVIASGLDVPRGLALDASAGKLYWTDSGTDKIQRSNLNGSEVEDVVTGLHTPARLALGPIAIAAPNRAPTLAVLEDRSATAGDTLVVAAVGRDPDGDALTYAAATSDSSIATARAADSLVTLIALAAGRATITVTARDSGGLEAAQTFVLTVQAPNRAPEATAFLFWTDSGAGRIQRSNLEGTGVEEVVTGLEAPVALALDGPGGRIYWADRGAGRIQRVALDGFFVEEVVTGLEEPGGLALDPSAGKLYWTDSGAGRIQRAALDSTEVEEVVTGLQDPGALALDPSAGQGLLGRRRGQDSALEPGRHRGGGGGHRSGGTRRSGPGYKRRPRSTGPTAAGKIQRSNLDGTKWRRWSPACRNLAAWLWMCSPASSTGRRRGGQDSAFQSGWHRGGGHGHQVGGALRSRPGPGPAGADSAPGPGRGAGGVGRPLPRPGRRRAHLRGGRRQRHRPGERGRFPGDHRSPGPGADDGCGHRGRCARADHHPAHRGDGAAAQ